MAVLELGIMRHHVQEKQKGQELIDWAMQHGVNHFEACWFYMDGQCEPYLYSLLNKYNREDYFICGKLPIHNVLNNMTHQALFEEQLRRVPGHYFDTYLLQALDERVILDIQEKKIVEFFLEQKKKGTIKRFGLSIQCLPSTFKKYLEWGCWDVVQMPLNYYDWFLCRYDENYKLACEYGLPIIAQAPVKGGLLVKPENIPTEEFEVSLTQAAFTFLNQLDNIEMVLCGNSSVNTFQQSYQAFMNKDVHIEMDHYQSVMNNFIHNNYIDCSRCGRCARICPMHIPISAFFTYYNLALTNKSYFNALDILRNANTDPHRMCRQCRACENVCPQHLNVFELMRYKVWELRT